jgi:hypothetical protein
VIPVGAFVCSAPRLPRVLADPWYSLLYHHFGRARQ